MFQSSSTGQPYTMSTPSRPIKKQRSRNASIARSPFSTSYLSASPIAQESIARDLLECSDDEDDRPDSPDSGSSSSTSTVRPDDHLHRSMVSSFRRPSVVAYGATRPAATPQHLEAAWLTKKEKKQSRNEERSLLRDNHLVPPKHAEHERGLLSRLYRSVFSTKIPKPDEEAGDAPLFTNDPSESSLLLPEAPRESRRTQHERLNRQWEEAVAAGKIQTTWQRETMTLWKYSLPLVVTFSMYSYILVSNPNSHWNS